MPLECKEDDRCVLKRGHKGPHDHGNEYDRGYYAGRRDALEEERAVHRKTLARIKAQLDAAIALVTEDSDSIKPGESGTEHWKESRP